MGYNTYFKGRLIFDFVSDEELQYIESFMGEDVRNHPEWIKNPKHKNLTHIDWQITEDKKGIEWNESEKSYDMDLTLELILDNMNLKFPNFSKKIVAGEILAQGEDQFDRYKILVNWKGQVVKKWIINNEGEVHCPHCGKDFKLE